MRWLIPLLVLTAGGAAAADQARFMVPDGYIDRTGAKVISIPSSWERPFAGGRACVKPSNGAAQEIIDPQGKTVFTHPKLDCGNDGPNLSFASERTIVLIDGKPVVLSRDGQIVATPTWNGRAAEQSLGFSDGLAAVRFGDKWGYVDPDGKLAIAPQFGPDPDAVDSFHEGRAAVHIGQAWQYIDKSGKVVSETAFAARPPVVYQAGVLNARVKDKPTWLGRDGGVKFTPCCQKYGGEMYEGAQVDQGSDGSWEIETIDSVRIASFPASVVDVGNLSEGLVAIEQRREDDGRERWGYADRTGRIVIEPVYVEARAFEDGLAIVSTPDDKWIYIDKNGDEVWSSQRKRSGYDFGFVIRDGATEVVWTSPAPHRMRRHFTCDAGVPDGDRVTFDGRKAMFRAGKPVDPDFARKVMGSIPDGDSVGFWAGGKLSVYTLGGAGENKYGVDRRDWVDGTRANPSYHGFELTVVPEAPEKPKLDHQASVAENKEGMDKYRARDFRTAAARFQHAIAADPDYVLARYNLASVASIEGDLDTVVVELGALARIKDPSAQKAVEKGKTDADLDRASTDPAVRRALNVVPFDRLSDLDVLLERNGVWTFEDDCESHVLVLTFAARGKLDVHELGGCTGDKIDVKRTGQWTSGATGVVHVEDPAISGDVKLVPCGGVERACLRVGGAILRRGAPAGP